MFIGTFEHNIDGKNRVFIPAEFREELGQSFVCKLYPSKQHPSIQLYKKEDYKNQTQVPVIGRPHPDKMRDALAASFLVANSTTCDSHGRISLNSVITKRARIDGKCIFVGFGEYIEIMSPEVYESYIDKIYDDNEQYEQAFTKEAELYREMTAEGKFIDVGGSDAPEVK